MFYLGLATLGRNTKLGGQLNQTRLPTKADRNRALLGHVKTTMPANPLSPRGNRRRHPRMLPDDARELLLAAVNTARDRLMVTWFYDGGFRIGELCGPHLADLHLRENADCAECRTPHMHICHRDDNRNASRAKSKHPWELVNGIVHGGLMRRVSPGGDSHLLRLHDASRTWKASCSATQVFKPRGGRRSVLRNLVPQPHGSPICRTGLFLGIRG